MVRRKTQKGSGVFNTLRTFFRGKEVAPSQTTTATTTTAKTQRRVNVKDESYRDALRRVYVFFYYKLKGLEPPREQRFITPEQEQEVKETLLQAKGEGEGVDQDEIIRTLFHANPVKFQQELSDWEEYKPDGFLNKGTPYERRAFSIAKSLDRFIGTIQNSPKYLKYKSNFMVNICETTNFEEVAVTLSDDYCITVLTPNMKEAFEDNKGSAYPLSYIMVEKEFFPPRATISGGPITLNAKRLGTISFLLDAFRQNGILEIEPVLKSTIEREAPELLQFSYETPVVIASPVALKDPSVTRDRFILLDFDGERDVIDLKEVSTRPLIQNAFARRKVYIMDPKTMCYIRENLYPLWLANYGSANTNIYRRLLPNEKSVFCFLQYSKFKEFYSVFRDAKRNNNNATRERKIQVALEKAKRLVFEADYAAGANPYELASNFTITDQVNWKALIRFQIEVNGSAAIQTPQELQALLSKLSLQKNSVAETVFPPPRTRTTTRRLQANTKEELKQKLLQKRKILVDQLQTVIATPVKSSTLPNFMRTRKAKQENAQIYRARINAARKQLVDFNEKYGIRPK